MSDVENCIIIGSGPAGWSAAIYAARANLRPLLFEGAMTEENRIMGRFPMGQLAQTTEVENYAGFPSGKLKEFIDSAIDPSRQYMYPPVEEHPHAVTGPELMELMRQQATNFGTRVITDDIVSVDFSKKPMVLNSSENGSFQTRTVILATGASANYLGIPSEEKFRNRGVSACAVCDGALPRFRNKPLVVVGGGDSAVEEASYLTKYASKVYLILRRGEMRASKILDARSDRNVPCDRPYTEHQVPRWASPDPCKRIYRLDAALQDHHQRRRSLCGWRRGRRLLSSSDHIGRYRLHGCLGRRALSRACGSPLIRFLRPSFRATIRHAALFSQEGL